jgi:Protein of unknown function (DUF1552)
MKNLLNRRTFLRGAGVCMSLPFLDIMQPAFGAAPLTKPRRMVAIQTNQGILPQFFFPEKAGKDYQLTPYLKLLEKHRSSFTVFSGVSHPDVDGGHAAERTFLSAAPHPGSPTFRPTVSIDQLAAEELGVATRFPSLTLSVQSGNVPNQSVTRGGVTLPTEQSPARLYQQLFVDVKPEEIEGRIRELRGGRSLLDFVGESSKQLQQKVGTRDRERLDQYFTSVRDLEQRMVRMEEWERKPKPKVNAPSPQDIADSNRFVEKARLILDMVRLALETDSSRIVSFFLDATAIHPITHHGNRPEVIEQLRKVEESQFQVLNNFLTALSEVKEEGETLLDRTMVLYGTCMGSANSHSNYNLPVLLAGGGFKHGQHLAFDPKPGKNYPLPNLFVSMLQRMGLEIDKFATSTGTMRGLEAA